MIFHYKFFFFLVLIIGSLISISSNSWLGMWLGLEINLLAFIPLIQEKNNKFSTESSMKYFLVQALASTIILYSLIFLHKNFMMTFNIENAMLITFNSALLTKMGMAPFHFWFPEVIESLSWLSSLILLTWQKITPMILVMYTMNFQYLYIIVIIFSLLVSGILGFNQMSLRKILAYSSINHMAWMINAMIFSKMIWFFYLMTYFILTLNIVIYLYFSNIYYFHQLISSFNYNLPMKFLFSLNFLSLGGLPPFLGFFPKWLTIQSSINVNWIIIPILMVFFTLMTLFYYLRLIYSIFIFTNNEVNFYSNSSNNYLIIFSNLISVFSLIICSLTFLF